MTKRRILIATDAWTPQVNGVVRTLQTTIRYLKEWGHSVEVIAPERFWNFPAPAYPEIRLAVPWISEISRWIMDFQPDHLHIATEGPIGLATRAWANRRRFRFTTSYHTKFPEYLHELLHLPLNRGYGFMRWFHKRSAGMMVATPTLEAELRKYGLTPPINRWSRGVDLQLFYPRPKNHNWLKPVLLYAGRVSKEKNIDAFLSLPADGTKVIVGDGPYRAELEKRYPKAVFLGYRRGNELAEAYSQADVFVFPSRTDTFGLVIIEALACGVPVAAYPVIGPVDILNQPGIGALDNDLNKAVQHALQTGEQERCVAHAHGYTWEQSTGQFLSNLRNMRTGEAIS